VAIGAWLTPTPTRLGGKKMTTQDGRLHRSNDKVIAGVCAGLAEKLGWPANRLRLGYVILSILSAAFPGILVYIVLWIVMPGPND
jgi:phage shock protein PspC (stress-responsive transcriptional regulator)